MKTTITVFVKNEGFMTRAWSFLWFINIFKKFPVKAVADFPINQPEGLLMPSDQPYVFEVEPGEHAMIFTDPRAKSKKAYNKVAGAFIGSTVGLSMGMDLTSMIAGGMIGTDLVKDMTPDMAKGTMKVELKDGDNLQISVQAKNNGLVKIKVLK